MRNLICAQKTRVRGGSETQPDSCYAWFDPAAVVVTATVNGKIHRLMDHRLIRMRYQIKGIVPREREFYEFEREIRNKDIKHTDICERLNDEVNKWIHTYGCRALPESGAWPSTDWRRHRLCLMTILFSKLCE